MPGKDLTHHCLPMDKLAQESPGRLLVMEPTEVSCKFNSGMVLTSLEDMFFQKRYFMISAPNIYYFIILIMTVIRIMDFCLVSSLWKNE